LKVVVTGATGFVGRPLCAELVGAGHRVTALTRDPNRALGLLGSQVRCVAWGDKKDLDWKQEVAAADAVIHLAGEAVAGQRWTPEFKARIRASRVENTKELAQALNQADRRPRTLVSASAVGYYGDCGDETVTEEHAPGKGFLADVCVEWEGAARQAREAGVRVALLRIGIVLGAGGALEKMLHPLPLPINPWKLGGGGPLGNGRQWMPWIHLDDVVGLFRWAATEASVEGPCNATAPNPVTNRDFAHTLGHVLHRPAVVPVPAFALRAMLGEFAESILTGQKAIPAVAQRLGYRFKFTAVEDALRAALRT
jgi:uncharacterized protein (TIGR01777 family)